MNRYVKKNVYHVGEQVVDEANEIMPNSFVCCQFKNIGKMEFAPGSYLVCCHGLKSKNSLVDKKVKGWKNIEEGEEFFIIKNTKSSVMFAMPAKLARANMDPLFSIGSIRKIVEAIVIDVMEEVLYNGDIFMESNYDLGVK